jgi:hypothetical protein
MKNNEELIKKSQEYSGCLIPEELQESWMTLKEQ